MSFLLLLYSIYSPYTGGFIQFPSDVWKDAQVLICLEPLLFSKLQR